MGISRAPGGLDPQPSASKGRRGDLYPVGVESRAPGGARTPNPLLRRVAVATSIQLVLNLARPEGLEPPTLCFEGRCSIQLSYGRTVWFCNLITVLAASDSDFPKSLFL